MKKFLTSSCTFLDNTSPLPLYAMKPSSTRAAEDQRRSLLRGGAAWRQEVTLSSKVYGKSRLTPTSKSYLDMLTWIPTSMSQWISSWLVGRRKIRIIIVSTATTNGRFYPFFLSVDVILGKKDIFVLSGLSRLMAKNSRNPFHTYMFGSMDASKLWS